MAKTKVLRRDFLVGGGTALAAGALTAFVPESADAAPAAARHLRTIHRLHRLRQPPVSRLPELHVCLLDDARRRGEPFGLADPDHPPGDVLRQIPLRHRHVGLQAVRQSALRPELPDGRMSRGRRQRQRAADRRAEMHRLQALHQLLPAATSQAGLERGEEKIHKMRPVH